MFKKMIEILYIKVFFMVLLGGSLFKCSSSAKFESCQSVHGRNLSELSGTWPAYRKTAHFSEIYLLNICNGLSDPVSCNGSSVCLNMSGHWLSLGNHSISPTVQSANSTSISFYLEYNTTQVCKFVEGRKYYYRSSVTFECGRTLGSPIVISSDNCSVDFLWETSRACLSHATDARKEVRCYVFDSNGKKRDLEYLVKQSGGHYVKDPSSTQTGTDGVYINVCRDIQVDSLHSCPADAAACLVKNGHSYILGTLTSGVNITEGRLILEYLAPRGSSVPTECNGFTPRVIITFVCPGSGRGGSKPPIITSSINCQYNIEWWTEAACPIDSISSSTCGLNAQDHGIDLDLSPLKKPDDHFYTVNTSSSDTKFFLNVCAKSGVSCGKDSERENNAVCQSPHPDSNGYIAGDKRYYKVKYYDGQLSLTYSKGERCNSNGYRRTSVILFHCNKSAGVGSPTFNHELHCNYYFDWHTSYACVNVPTCHVTDDAGQAYDVSTLTRIAGHGATNWRVLNSHKEEEFYYLNICGELLKEDRTSSCPAGSSVCSISGKKVQSFGSFSSSTLTRRANKLVLTYESGSLCADKKQKKTTIIFYCKLGDLESSPVLKYVSSDECHLVLTWHTAAACPLKSVNGSNCMVSDEDSGLTFDLQRLTKPKSKPYKLTLGSYDYYLNVCDDVDESVCGGSGRHAAACQVELHGEQRKFILGETSKQLLYYNGFVKLLYSRGDSYSDHKHNRSLQISFLCDPKKGAGAPEYVKEAKHTYVFNWYTSYVCPFASTQCMVTDSSGRQYDLSSLSKSEDDQDANWSVLGEEVAGKGKRKYYLNVCRPVNEVQASSNRDIGCDGLAGACETIISSGGEETISVASLGRPSLGPRMESGDRLVLTYSNGDNCTEDGQTKKFETRIHFSCDKGALSSSPRFLERTSCSASFDWATEAACPIETSKGVETDMLCEVKSRTSQYVFNLEPLKRNANDPYVVTGQTGSSYELNVCGSVSDCKKSGDSASFGGCRKNGSSYGDKVLNHTAPSYSDDGRLSIAYKTPDRINGNFHVFKIDFVCNRSVAKGKPVFSGIDGFRTRFDFQTSLACEPQSVDCLVADNYGNQYDLTPLSTYDRPWRVIDIHQSRHFYLSVCRPLPPVDGCKGGASGACYFEGRGETGNGTNLGLVRSNPQAVSNGGQSSAVTIMYMGGDRCKADPGRRYSTRITFQCSNVEGLPAVLQLNNPDPCEFFFTWQTPAACPIKKAVSGPGQVCSVVDPLYQMTFNLSSLTRPQDYFVRTGGEWDFNLNICGKLNGGLAACKDSGSCQVSHTHPTSTMHDAGKPNTTLSYEDGVVTLTYLHGEKCHHNKYDRSTVFRFTCHHSDDIKPTFINESADCTYLFDWPTPKVCPPINIVECIAQDSNGTQYDLSSLSLTNNNHAASTRGETGRVYYVNVCRSLLHKPGVTCPPNSAACFRTADKKFYNLGRVHSPPRFEDGKLSLTYTDGGVCLSNKNKNYTTTLHFQCDKNAALDSSPILTSDVDSCDVQLLWITRAACPISKQPPQPMQGCTAINPRSKHEFNLTSLAADKFYEVRAEDGRVFHINVCRSVTDSNCPDNTGTCVSQGGASYSAGRASSALLYSEGALSLRYENGKTCHAHPQYKYRTVISFVCHRSPNSVMEHPHNVASKPVFVGDDPDTCTHYFSWHTHLACEVQTPCQVVKYSKNHVPHLIDLSPLIKESGHYAAYSGASGSKAAYYINVCRPLEPITGTHCPPGSAACEITSGHVAKSLGYIDPMENFLSYDENSNTVVLQYKTNRTCSTNSSAKVSTKVVFSCLRGSTAVSELPGLTTVTSDCVYVFEWGTKLLCSPQNPTAPSTECSYHDTVTGQTYDLSNVGAVTRKAGLSTFKLDPCSAGFPDIPACKDSPVCFQHPTGQASSLGLASTRKLLSGASLKAPVLMTITNGSQCPNSPGKQQKVKIIFRCDQQQSIVASNKLTFYFNKQDPCEFTILWPTAHVCPMPSESCLAINAQTGLTYDLALLSSLTHSWTFTDKQDNKYYVNVCRRLSSRDSWSSACHENATVCRITKKEKKAQSFGILRSQEIEATLGHVIVRYRGGDRGLCTDPDMSASSEIRFECDKSITGAPQFKEISQSDCFLRITWKTRAACPDAPTSVQIDKTWSVTDPKSGNKISLAPLVNKTWIASADMRQDKNGVSVYNYAISLRGQLDSSQLTSSALSTCTGNTAVCQYKPNQNFARKIAEVPPSYVMTDDALEINFTSTDRCGKNKNKTSHVFITLRCSQYTKLGSPTFIYESNECGYFFQWYTSVMCQQENQVFPSASASSAPDSNHAIASDKETHEATDRHSHTAAVVVGVLVCVTVVIVMFFVLRNPQGRIAVKRIGRRALCCVGSREPSYRFIRSEDVSDEEGTSLFSDGGIVREETSLLKATSRNRSTNPFETEHVDILPIGSSLNSDSENDLFDIPEVRVSGSSKKKKKSTRAADGRKRGAPTSSNVAESDDLLDFIKPSPTDRAPGVGSEKATAYHDDDDVDMLDA